MTNNLSVSEVFTSIQGEGKTTGVPSVFLRLGGCNLMCGGIGTQKDKELHDGAKWRCDTIEVWTKFLAKNFEEVLTKEQEKLICERDFHLVITGGEPFLHQSSLIKYIEYLRAKYGRVHFIEIETNGTVAPKKEFLELIDQINCSPKLSNSGNKKERRYRPRVLETLQKHHNIQFKFVIAETQDWKEIQEDFHFIEKSKITLMPAGENRELLEKSRNYVVNLCIKEGIRYTDRQHIVIWNKKTGV